MIIGTFTYDSSIDTYAGEIRTLSFGRGAIELRPLEKTSDREPDYRVVEVTSAGIVELGAAWQRRTERGQDYLSVQLDDPSFERSISAAMFPGEEDGSATLIWSRPQRRAEPAPDARGSPSGRRSPSRGLSRRGAAERASPTPR